MVEYQTRIHATSSTASLELWARSHTPVGLDLHWWETAAATASSLVVFALIAEAARSDLSVARTVAVEATYYPWIGALHVLLDSLIDQSHDTAAGHPSLVDNYHDPDDTADRLTVIAHSARRHVDALDEPAPHLLLLTAMSCFYLSSGDARHPPARLAAKRLTTELGTLATPMLMILRARRAASPRGIIRTALHWWRRRNSAALGNP
jgi:tetraprenyl-beta-curcumene synthase